MQTKIKVVETVTDLKTGKQGTIFRTKEDRQTTYKFGLWCKCGKKIEGCFCTYTIEEAKQAIEKQATNKAMKCYECYIKSKEFIEDIREDDFIMEELRGKLNKERITNKDIKIYAPEIASDAWDFDGDYGDGLYECECPLEG